MAELKLLLFQDIELYKIDHNMPVERLATTETKINERLLKRWVAHEISKWLSLSNKYHFNTFNLKKILMADVYLNEVYEKTFKLVRWKKDYDIYLHREFRFKIKESDYTVIPNTEMLKTKSNELDKQVSFNYQKFINTIEYNQKENFKASTPILYTGWTN